MPPVAAATAEAPAAAIGDAAAGDDTDTSSSDPPSPSSSPAFDPWLALKGRYCIPADEVRELVSPSGPFAAGGADALLLALLPAAAALARPPISRFHVGAAGLAGSGAVYVGANMEQPNCPLNQSLHAEQFLVCNMAARGERRLLTLAISAAPCGHCRQFYCELSRADEVRFVFGGASSSAAGAPMEGDAAAAAGGGGETGAASAGAAAAAVTAAAPPPPAPGPPRAYSLDELLPARFGPLDLLVPHDPVIEAAQRAAARHDRRRSSQSGGGAGHHHHHHGHSHRRASLADSADAAAVAAAEGVAAPPTAKVFPPLMLEAQDNRVAVAPWVLAGGAGAGGQLPSTPFLSAQEAAALAARAASDPTFCTAVEAAARAARHGSYAPYTRAPSGVVFITRGDAPCVAADAAKAGAGAEGGAAASAASAAVVGGQVGYLEAAAYNPGVPPFQAALAAGLALGEIRGLQDVAEVLVAELDEPAAGGGGGGSGGGGGDGGGGTAAPGATAGLVKHAFVTEAVVRAAAGHAGVRVWRVPLVRI